MKRCIVIFGATSKIAESAAREWAAQGSELILVGRSEERLQTLVEDLSARGAKPVRSYTIDFADYPAHEAFVAELLGHHEITTAFLCHGFLGEQENVQKSVAASLDSIGVNFLSYVSLLTPLAEAFSSRGSGEIVVVGSVAGDRGRASNYVYGCAKGATALFAQGLRNRLASKGVHVMTIKPGMVDTPMTAHLAKGPLFAQASQVGVQIVRALDRKRSVCYLPWWWLIIMTIIRLIPEGIFKRLKL